MKKILLVIFACVLTLTATSISQVANAQRMEDKVKDLLIGTAGVMVYNVFVNNCATMDAVQAGTLNKEDAKIKVDGQLATLKYVTDQLNAVIELQGDTKFKRADRKFYDGYQKALGYLYRQAQATKEYAEEGTPMSKTRYESFKELASSAVDKVMER